MLHYVHKLENRNLEKITGLFIFVALGVLIVVFVNIENRQNFFGGRCKVRIVFKQGFGLKKGSPVYMAGVEVGNIESISFNHKNNITVTAGIQKKYKDKVRIDSVATVVNRGLMGKAALSITIGSFSRPVVEDGEYIRGIGMSKTDGIMSGINPILMKANEAVDNIIYLTGILDKPLERIDHILKNLDLVSGEIREGRGNLGALLKDKDLYLNLTKMVGSSQRLLISMEKAVNNIELASQLFPDVINKAESSMMKINKSAEKIPYLFSEGKELISNIKGSSNEFNKLIRDSQKQIIKVSEILRDFKVASAELPDVIRASQENIDEITRIVEGAGKNWIIKGLIERKKKEEPIIVDVRDGHYDEIIRE